MKTFMLNLWALVGAAIGLFCFSWIPVFLLLQLFRFLFGDVSSYVYGYPVVLLRSLLSLISIALAFVTARRFKNLAAQGKLPGTTRPSA